MLRIKNYIKFLGYYKMRIRQFIEQSYFQFKLRSAGNIIQQGAIISKDSILKGGNYIGEYSNINEKSVLGKNVRVGSYSKLTNVNAGDGTVIEGFSILQGVGGNTIQIGENSYISSHSILESSAELQIGNHVSIGPNLRIVTHTGHIQALTDSKIGSPDYLLKKSVKIEDHVYIGVGTIIQMGVTIGKFSIISAGSIVTKSIPPFSLAQGVPAKVVGNVVIEGNIPKIVKI
jgi:acetyltransferase-like isoleucine patch superfamily enzyme